MDSPVTSGVLECFYSSFAPAWDDFLAIQNTNVEIMKNVPQCNTFCCCREHVHILLNTVSSSLIPDQYTFKSSISSVMAFHFYKSFLSPAPVAFSENVREFVLKFCILKCFDAIKHISIRSHEDSSPLIHAMAFISELLRHPINSFYVDHTLNKLHGTWICLERLVTTTYMHVICCQNGVATDLQLAFLYESLHAWKHALRVYTRLDLSHCLYQTTEAFSTLLRVLHTCLIQYPEQVKDRSPDGKDVLLHPTEAYLLVRSFMDTCKLMLQTDWLLPLCSSAKETLFHIICGRLETPPNAMSSGSTIGVVVAGLARWESGISSEKKLRRMLFDPDPGASLRLLIVAALQLQFYHGNFDERSLYLLRSLRMVVLATHDPAAHSPPLYEELLLSLLADDDACLFNALYLFLKLEESAHKAEFYQNPTPDPFPDAHRLFACFAQLIDYSPYVLLDWLISPETKCLDYMVHYLRLFRRRETSTILEHLDPTAPPEWISIHWPRAAIKSMLNKLAASLTKLSFHGNVPFNPSALIRALHHAVNLL